MPCYYRVLVLTSKKSSAYLKHVLDGCMSPNHQKNSVM